LRHWSSRQRQAAEQQAEEQAAKDAKGKKKGQDTVQPVPKWHQ